ncbi:ABC transporter substrate-binding protein [Flavivirga aquatica]|uniref:ABC transporter substrate-binding protein n=1 Tax=Flavivirga aquatica TaxID=1849968 RepID=A0A1E5T8H1_9FLAO|nr:MlaD family protein [Flavivirga aquatica]OEK07682.1 ABC transporter substrate-binding protein [Flavivirga aquatica]
MKVTREVKTGVLVLLGVILFIFGFNYLKGQNLLDSSRTYYAVYDNVEGLIPSTPVTISGLSVGKVVNISFKEDNSGKILVKLLVDSEFQFSKNSKAELYETGLIGGKAIAIIPAFDNAENAKSGEYLQGGLKAGLTDLLGQKLTPLQGKIEKMMTSADILLSNLNDVFDAKTKENLKISIAELSTTMRSFKNTSVSLNQIIKGNQNNIDKVLSNANKLTGDLSNITESMSKSDLGKTIKNLELTLQKFNNILSNLDAGKGSMGKLLNDDKLYNNLEGASKEMEALLKDIKLHPKRYFRILSKKEIPYQEPETN